MGRGICKNATYEKNDETTVDISKFRGKSLDDGEKSEIIAECFYLLGFEVFPIENLKNKEPFKLLHQIRHVDVVAYYPPINTIYLIEEKKKFQSIHFAKFETSIIELLKDFIDLQHKLTIHFVIIGNLSSKLKLPERISVIKLSHDEFEDFFKKMLQFNPSNIEFSRYFEGFYKKLKLDLGPLEI